MRALTTSVTALHFVEIDDDLGSGPRDVLLAGIGNQVRIFESNVDVPIAANTILPYGERVHGFSAVRDSEVLVHGGYYLAIAKIALPHADKPGSISRLALKRFEDWVWGARWISASRFFAVACGHSHVWLCTRSNVEKSVCVKSAEQELTWATTLFEPQDGLLRAVAGTSFGDVLLWDVFDKHHTLDHTTNVPKFPLVEGDVNAPRNVLRLKAHDGPIMKLKVSSDAQTMASASVDRSVRVWSSCNATVCSRCLGTGCYNVVLVHYGHLARVWDVAFLRNEGLGVVSAAEDRTCRVWSANDEGEEVAVFHGHSGRNVWSLDVQIKTDGNARIATGGEDGCIKLRSFVSNANEIRPESDPAGFTHSFASRRCISGSFPIPGRYANPRKTGGAYNESGRTLRLVSEESLLVSTDFGRIFAAHIDAPTGKEDTLLEKNVLWTELYRCETGIAYTPSSLAFCNGLVFAGQTNGQVTVLRTCSESGRITSAQILITFGAFLTEKVMVMGLFVNADPVEGFYNLLAATGSGDLYYWRIGVAETFCVSATYLKTFQQTKPTKSAVVTSAIHLAKAGIVVAGDRGGRVLVYDARNVEMSHDPATQVAAQRPVIAVPMAICKPHADRVSAMHHIRSADDLDAAVAAVDSSTRACEIMTAGFDGIMTRLVLETVGREGRPRMVRITLTSCQKTIEHVDTIGKLVFPRVLDRSFPEGIANSTSNDKFYTYSREMVIGFRSADIVVWDLRRRNELFRTNCGNWRRAYDVHLDVCCPSTDADCSGRLSIRHMTFVFWRSGRLHVIRTFGNDVHAIGDDTRSDALDSDVQSMGAGFHGQRANALCWLPGIPSLLSASEDTTLCVTRLRDAQLRTEQTLNGHISGVNGVCAVALPDGSCAALSGGGSDEVLAWHAAGGTHATWRKVGGCRVGQGDLQRVLCVTVLGACDCGCVVGACGRSDGSLAVVRTGPGKGKGFRKAGSDWDVKVLQVSEEEGRGAVLCCASGYGVVAGEMATVVACGDSRGRLWLEIARAGCVDSNVSVQWSWDKAHAGGVNAVDAVIIGDWVIVVSGGDDERVQVWHAELRCESDGEVSVHNGAAVWHSSVGLHRAAVTGVCFVEEEKRQGRALFCSVGADQRVVFGEVTRTGSAWTVYCRDEQSTSIADAATVRARVVANQKTTTGHVVVQAAVAGGGLEVLEADLHLKCD